MQDDSRRMICNPHEKKERKKREKMITDRSYSIVRMTCIDTEDDDGGGGVAVVASSVVVGQKRFGKTVYSVYSASVIVVVATLQHELDGLESPVTAQNPFLRLPVANPIAPS